MAQSADQPASVHRLPRGARVGAVLSSYHGELTRQMLDSARRDLERAGLAQDDLLVVEVPGAFELPIVARRLALRDDVAAVLCFGLVLKGETRHDEYIASAVSEGLQRVALDHDKPVLFGVLTCDTLAQAQARALAAEQGGLHDKGREVARAAVAVLAALESARSAGARTAAIGFGPRGECQAERP